MPVKVLIVAKTRRGTGACVGGIDQDGRSVRLIAADAETNHHAGLEYAVGDVWELETAPAITIIPPHVEDVLVLEARRLRTSDRMESTIRRFMPPVSGGPEVLFDGRVQATEGGGLFVTERTGLPSRSTMFWQPDKPLQLDSAGKRIHYRYPTEDGGRTLTFVGFQEPIREIPAGTLVRISLAHHWRPKDKPALEMRCFLQISGWLLSEETSKPAGVETVSRRANHLSASPPADPLPAAREILKRTFGYSDFFPVQGEAIRRVLQKKDTFTVMPTGGGKSICYQLPALIFDGLTVVVSPLIALMQDQVRQLHQLNVPAACLNHMTSMREWTTITREIRQGVIRILYVSPETLLRPEILLLLSESRTRCLAIDEAHCISEWGHDFRPEYRQLRGVRERFKEAVCLVLTATAPPRVREDICHVLGIPKESALVASFNRPNLFISVESRSDRLRQILSFLRGRRGESGIIYCAKRKDCEQLCDQLNAHGWPALPYHAGLGDTVRTSNQEKFIRDDVSLMVATIAFGMGINKSNVRFVIHANLPKDIESYYQEIGRAGRDGIRADCLLLHSRADAMVYRRFIDEGAPSERPGRNARLDAIMRYAEGRECRRVPLLHYFGEQFQAPCGHCDNCTRAPAGTEAVDVTEQARLFLTCVRATGQMFGPAHIIGVLRGSRAERILSRHHDLLPCHGSGAELSEKDWRKLVDDFLRLGLIEQDLGFGGLRLAPRAEDVLNHRERVSIHRGEKPAPATPEHSGQSDGLLRRLKALRKELATNAGVPAYVVFSDATLIEMARVLPRTETDFLTINGVGEVKLQRYGREFLAAINGSLAVIESAKQGRSHQVGARFAGGESIADLAKAYGVQEQTIVDHLHAYVQSGGSIDPDRLLATLDLPEAVRNRAISLFETLGYERLAPVFQALEGSVSYAHLHRIRAYLAAREQSR